MALRNSSADADRAAGLSERDLVAVAQRHENVRRELLGDVDERAVHAFEIFQHDGSLPAQDEGVAARDELIKVERREIDVRPDIVGDRSTDDEAYVFVESDGDGAFDVRIAVNQQRGFDGADVDTARRSKLQIDRGDRQFIAADFAKRFALDVSREAARAYARRLFLAGARIDGDRRAFLIFHRTQSRLVARTQ